MSGTDSSVQHAYEAIRSPHPIVDMIVHDGHLFVATTHGVYDGAD